MKTRHFIYCAMTFAITQVFSQQSKVASADKQYANYAYVDAISVYEKVVEKGYKNEDILQKLGNAYYFKADLPKAATWYDQLFAMNPNQEPEYYYRYSQSLKSVGNYEKADQILGEFSKRSVADKRSQLYQNQKDYLTVIKANSGRYTIEDAGVNSEFSDYGSALLDGKLVYASARDTVGRSGKKFKWTGESFTNLYWSGVGAEGSKSEADKLPKSINTKFHESTPVFTKDGKTMYFTRNNYLDGKRGADAQKVTLLKLYKASRGEDGKWGEATELPFDSNDYSTAHPALSQDEKTLYFASDMPGSIGQSDIYKVSIDGSGGFGTPVNLGEKINTEGRETFPYLAKDNQLYFASDGHPGLGGLDVFVGELKEDGSFGKIQNVGMPVNSPQDDFAFMIDSQSKQGYFTSNRDGGHGQDDIYKLTEIKPLKKQMLEGLITDAETGNPLPGAKVGLYDSNYKLIKEIAANAEGAYSFEVDCDTSYYVRASQPDYETKEGNVKIVDCPEKTQYNLALDKTNKTIGTGTDLAKTLKIPMIYFDLDKYNIREDAEIELAKVLVVMEQYPKMKIDVRSHTDCRNTNAYNDVLSNNRAKSTIAWLVKKGISSGRLTGKGYGETQLVNHCSDGVDCTEAEHQANRRSEFIVVSME